MVSLCFLDKLVFAPTFHSMGFVSRDLCVKYTVFTYYDDPVFKQLGLFCTFVYDTAGYLVGGGGMFTLRLLSTALITFMSIST